MWFRKIVKILNFLLILLVITFLLACFLPLMRESLGRIFGIASFVLLALVILSSLFYSACYSDYEVGKEIGYYNAYEDLISLISYINDIDQIDYYINDGFKMGKYDFWNDEDKNFTSNLYIETLNKIDNNLLLNRKLKEDNLDSFADYYYAETIKKILKTMLDGYLISKKRLDFIDYYIRLKDDKNNFNETIIRDFRICADSQSFYNTLHKKYLLEEKRKAKK